MDEKPITAGTVEACKEGNSGMLLATAFGEGHQLIALCLLQRGALLGAARPLLVVKDPCVVEELNQLATNLAGRKA